MHEIDQVCFQKIFLKHLLCEQIWKKNPQLFADGKIISEIKKMDK